MLMKNKKKLMIIIVSILLIPIIIPIFYTVIDIIVNLGRYFGTIARLISEGICCESLF